ncbi:MAG TPA: MipA/OmpV family protein [Sphingomicrobium sp.]
MKKLLIAAVALAPAWTPALAQERKDIRVRVGAGAQLRPDFVGSDKMEVGPLWDVDIDRGSNEFGFEAPDYRFGIPVVSTGGFKFGPAASLSNARKDSDVGAPLGKVKRTFEAGAFASYEINRSLHLRGELVKGLGGHEGLVGQIGADHVWRDGDKYVFSVGPRLLFSDKKYQRAYFGVTPVAALASGLPAYQPGGGVHGVAMASGLSLQFNPRWGMFGFARYERLVGDAAKSPIVRELGSRNQVSVGAGLNYTFTIKR